MGVLSFVFLVCSLKTNVCLVIVFLCYTLAFTILAGCDWAHAEGNVDLALKLQIGGGACCFVVAMACWYVFIVAMFASVDFPIRLPLGDLSKFWNSPSTIICDVENDGGKMA